MPWNGEHLSEEDKIELVAKFLWINYQAPTTSSRSWEFIRQSTRDRFISDARVMVDVYNRGVYVVRPQTQGPKA